MSKKEKLEQALKEAMKAKDSRLKNTLRLVLSTIKEAEIEQKGQLDDSDVDAILQKAVKSRHETIADAKKAGRDEMITEAEAEIEILEAYLPQQLSDEELEALVDESIAQSGASSPADMGKVMGSLMPKVQGRADGGRVSQVVRARLQGG